MESAQPVLIVKSVAEAVAWYIEVLGFEPVYLNPGAAAGPPNYAVLRNGDAGLHLGLEAEMLNGAGQGAANSVTGAFEETCRRARESGAPFFIEAGEIPSGARTFGIRDPDGNLLTFVEST